MQTKDFVIFDTSTLPEYYNDVQKILALPEHHIVTYDYSAGHISKEANSALDELKKGKGIARAVLAYMQPEDYQKGAGSNADTLLPKPTFQTLTRLAEIVRVRTMQNDNTSRYYIDLKLRGYPYDPGRAMANTLIEALRAVDEIPMKIWMALVPGAVTSALFAKRANDEAFSQVVDSLSDPKSQFSKDTFWRLTKITYRTKSLIPLTRTKLADITPKVDMSGDRAISYLKVLDQSSLQFHLQFNRGKSEHGIDYRGRAISIEGSPKTTSDLMQSSFAARSFGQEIIAVVIPATSSLSMQEARYRILTQPHSDDEKKEYPYGPQIAVTVQYQKAVVRSMLAIASILMASAAFAWAAFSTSTSTADLMHGEIVSVWWRITAVAIGVLVSLYAYYLWNDDVALDKARRT